jgi:hypothetical protein
MKIITHANTIEGLRKSLGLKITEFCAMFKVSKRWYHYNKQYTLTCLSIKPWSQSRMRNGVTYSKFIDGKIDLYVLEVARQDSRVIIDLTSKKIMSENNFLTSNITIDQVKKISGKDFTELSKILGYHRPDIAIYRKYPVYDFFKLNDITLNTINYE